jgi:deazaflavin-dependent oxidoreductase (nitroreductase family)
LTDALGMEAGLVATAGFARIETIGRRSRAARPVTVGFIEEADGSIVVAASSPSTAWARNLLADPACHVVIGDRTFDAIAEALGRDDHIRAIRALILRYGTPAETLGRGPSFRLRRLVHA